MFKFCHVLCRSLLWLMKACNIAAPTTFSDHFVNELWRLNLIQSDPVQSILPLLTAFITNFNLPQTYFNQYQSAEEYYTTAIGGTPFLHFLRPTMIPTLRYSACTCTPNETVSQGQREGK